MPSIAELVAQNQQRQAIQKTIGANAQMSPENIAGASPQPAPTPPIDPSVKLPQRGMFPASLVLASDRSDSSREFRGMGARSAVFPYPPQTLNTKQTIQNITNIAAAGASIAIEVNNAKTPVQNIINLIAGTGMQLLPDASGGITLVSTAASDGLTHSSVPWESDPAYVAIREDFVSYTTGAIGTALNVNSIGAGWSLIGNNGGGGLSSIGAMTNIGSGSVWWMNTATAQNTGCLTLNTLQSADEGGNLDYNSAWPLFETTGWQLTWIFKVEMPRNSTSTAFSTAKKAIYIGLAGTTSTAGAVGNISRPDIFFGLRFDTSTSAPSINDSFFTFEAVVNNTFSSLARHNTQGTIKVTNVAPVAGTWHRLDITSTSAGIITMTLDGSSTNVLTVTVPTFSSSIGSLSGQIFNNSVGNITYTTGAATNPVPPFGPGSKITITGFITNAALDSTFSIARITGGGIAAPNISFTLLSPTKTTETVTGTISGLPAVIPVAMMGNDDTTLPTAGVIAMYVDFFSYIWNPKLGAGGTLVTTNPRYW